ncbi:MAG: electron transport complex subunit RsxC [Arsenophonus endosymbiont of Ceratovacuna japonica]
MINFFKKLTIKKKNIWPFTKGINLSKIQTKSNIIPILTIPLPNELIIPIKQHVGDVGNIIVKIGDYILKGQALTKGYNNKIPVHATTSGTITNIILHTITYNSNLKIICIKIQPDNKDKWCKRKPLSNYLQYSIDELLSHIEQSGIVGLSGSGIPTAKKLRNCHKLINTLIINATECEPYITADSSLIQEHTNEIIEGIFILIHILKPKEVFIGIEDNKQDAIIALKKSLLYKKITIKLKVIPSKYPSGEEKQLIKILTGKEIPTNIESYSIGILMQNISTVFAIKRAIINGEPLIERIITLTGKAIKKPGNYWIRLGTPINFILNQVDIIPQEKQIVIIGGPLMGFITSDLTMPIIKINQCIFIPKFTKINTHIINEVCIRCNFCTQVCPINLLPQQLYWFIKGQKHEKLKEYNLFDCIECGACSYVCPSNIPLVHYYKQEKEKIKNIEKQKQKILDAKKRFKNKKNRINQEKIIRQKLHNQNILNININNKKTIKIIPIKINNQKNINNKNILLNDNNVTIKDIQDKQNKLKINRMIKTSSINKYVIIEENKIKKTLINIRKEFIANAISRVISKRNSHNKYHNNQ